jgi:hypothetical protein
MKDMCCRSIAFKVLVGGGCHIVGYPSDMTSSFVEVAQSRLRAGGITVTCSLLPYLKLQHHRRLERFLRENSGDILVLQLGHAESHRTFRQWFTLHLGVLAPRICRRLRIGAKAGDTSSESGSKSSAASMRPFETVWSRIRWQIRAWIKWCFDTVCGRPLVDRSEIKREFTRMIEVSLRYFDAGRILILLPLPCADPTISRYRSIISGELASICAVQGIRCMDVDGVVDIRRLSEDPYEGFFDSLHLSEKGHAAVGDVFAREIELLHGQSAPRRDRG